MATKQPRIQVRTLTVTDREQTQWQEMQARTGLRAQDVMRRALRIAHEVDSAVERGATVEIVEQNGCRKQLVMV